MSCPSRAWTVRSIGVTRVSRVLTSDRPTCAFKLSPTPVSTPLFIILSRG